MNTIVESVLSDLRREQGARQVEVHIGKLPWIDGDPALLRQAFANLLSNAYKFTRHHPRAVIDRHQGRVWAEAAVGRGATFFFTLNSDRPRVP